MSRHFNLKKSIKEIFRRRSDGKIDWSLIGPILFLTAFGFVMLASVGAPLGWQKFQDVYWHVKHQFIFGFVPGIILFFILSRLDYQRLKKLAMPLLIFSIVLLVLVFIPGVGAGWGTAQSWLDVFGFSLQPSEIVKLTFLLYLAAWLAGKGDKHLKNFNYGFAPFVFILGLISFLVILQPDFGTMFIIALMSLIVYFVAGGSLIHLFWLSIVGGGGLSLLIKFNPRRLARLTTFLHPEFDPQGIGYQINQALLAVGSGRFFGRGYGHSRQKFAYLPETIGDSIFAIAAEELGFFIICLIVLVFVFIALRGLKLASRCDDLFGKLLVVGIISWFTIQAFLNIGAIIGLLPLTGVPLPFVSYGGTALLTSLAAAGILANISKQT